MRESPRPNRKPEVDRGSVVDASREYGYEIADGLIVGETGESAGDPQGQDQGGIEPTPGVLPDDQSPAGRSESQEGSGRDGR